jgi:hypothetical protein
MDNYIYPYILAHTSTYKGKYYIVSSMLVSSMQTMSAKTPIASVSVSPSAELFSDLIDQPIHFNRATALMRYTKNSGEN